MAAHDLIKQDGSKFKPLQIPQIDTLPPEIWARILDFSVFSDAVRLAHESDFVKNEVLPLLRFLYFDTGMEYTWIELRNYAFDMKLVEEIVLDCLICNVIGNETFEVLQGLFRILGLVDFLSGLKNVKHVLIGKGENETKSQILERLWLAGCAMDGYVYKLPKIVDVCHPCSPRDHNAAGLYQAILGQFSHGYKQGMLSSNVQLHGLPSQHTPPAMTPSPLGTITSVCLGKDCNICQNVLRYFPLYQLITLRSSVKSYFPAKLGSVPLDCRLEQISVREGGKDLLIERQGQLWRDLFGNYDTELFDDIYHVPHSVITLEESVLRSMALLKECGCDPSRIQIRNVHPFCHPRKIKRATYLRLFEIGFQMNEDDFVAILSDGRTVATL
jgi:hypothetical protein